MPFTPRPGTRIRARSFLAAAAAPEGHRRGRARRPHLRRGRTPGLTDGIDSITHHTDQLRRNATVRREDA
ncbi:hypothetical protein [Streptomyces sp900116325]|uniref:hypothetical protein n=1 Tax=Streptomyces sp. 900116325 TaxID=3154295 RepID=UPI003320CCF5